MLGARKSILYSRETKASVRRLESEARLETMYNYVCFEKNGQPKFQSVGGGGSTRL